MPQQDVAAGCWVHAFAGEEYRPPATTYTGPSYERHFARGASSLVVGPGATLVGYFGATYEPPSLHIPPNTRLPQLGSSDFHERVDSFQVVCTDTPRLAAAAENSAPRLQVMQRSVHGTPPASGLRDRGQEADMMNFKRFAITILTAGLAASANAQHLQSPVLASTLVGTQVINPAGADLGWIAGLLLDTRQSGQHYALLATEDVDGQEKRFAFPLNAFRAVSGELVLNVPHFNLEIAPGYQQRAWPSPEVRSGDRFVRARDVLGRPLVDTLGERVGTMHDMLVSLDNGTTLAVMVEFADGERLAIPAHAVQLAPDGAATLHPDGQRLG